MLPKDYYKNLSEKWISLKAYSNVDLEKLLNSMTVIILVATFNSFHSMSPAKSVNTHSHLQVVPAIQVLPSVLSADASHTMD